MKIFPTIVKCEEIPQWIISSDKAAYVPFTKEIYLTKWCYLPHELLHWLIDILHLPERWHYVIDEKGTFLPMEDK